jgi:hypothetical protein
MSCAFISENNMHDIVTYSLNYQDQNKLIMCLIEESSLGGTTPVFKKQLNFILKYR